MIINYFIDTISFQGLKGLNYLNLDQGRNRARNRLTDVTFKGVICLNMMKKLLGRY
jgi:hypothetical protein